MAKQNKSISIISNPPKRLKVLFNKHLFAVMSILSCVQLWFHIASLTFSMFVNTMYQDELNRHENKYLLFDTTTVSNKCSVLVFFIHQNRKTLLLTGICPHYIELVNPY